MSTQPVALITGANGEIGRSLVERLHADGRYRIVVLDLTAVPDRVRGLCEAAYTGNILDRNLLDQIAAHHEIGAVFHLAALLSSRGERDPELAHQINVEGTLHLLRSERRDRLTFSTSLSVRYAYGSGTMSAVQVTPGTLESTASSSTLEVHELAIYLGSTFRF